MLWRLLRGTRAPMGWRTTMSRRANSIASAVAGVLPSSYGWTGAPLFGASTGLLTLLR